MIIRSYTLAAVFALLTTALLAQRRETYAVTIPAPTEKLGVRSFYIDAVEDARLDRTSIGSAQIGLDNRRVLAVLAQPFEVAFGSVCYQLLASRSEAQALTLRVEELFVDEVTKPMSERGSARIAISLVLIGEDGAARVVGTASGSAEEGAVDASGKLGRLVVDALSEALLKIDRSDWRSVAAGAILLTTDDSPTFTRVVALPTENAVYASADDFGKRAAMRAPYQLKPVGSADGYTYKLKGADGAKAPRAEVIVHGGEVYLATSKYNGGMAYGGVFRKALQSGRYIYFVDAWSSAAAGAAFGLIGAMASTRQHGVVLDPMSGQVYVLTPEIVTRLAEGHPDLQASMTDTKRGDALGMLRVIKELNARYAERN